MVFSILTNSANDLYVGPSGSVATSSGLLAVEAACATASQVQLAEAIYQDQLGQPTFESVWNGTPNLAMYEAALRQTLLGVPGVVNVTSINAEVNGNTLSYTAQIESVYGKLYLSG